MAQDRLWKTAAGAGALNVAADGCYIDFGTGATSTLSFAIFNPGNYTLTIDNWTGTPGQVGDATTDRLIFSSDPTSSLSHFFFSGYDNGAVALALSAGCGK